MDKKEYLKPIVETITLNQDESLLAGSPEVYDEISRNDGYSRSLEDFADDADELTGQMNRLFIITE